MTVAIIGAAIVAWVLIGLGARMSLLRRGHRRMSMLTAAVLGPFVVVIAIENAHWSPTRPPRLVDAGVPGQGPIDLLVGVDTSPDSEAAVRYALELLGSRMGSLTIATVIAFDFADEGERQSAEHDARARLESIGAGVVRQLGPNRTPLPELVVLSDAPADVLAQQALAREANLIVVGKRGQGLSKAIIGSVASQLARDARVPVLIVGA
jgi:nucleotide-binding universal stress UspA family protein